MPRGRKKRTKAGYTIGSVAELYKIHPQTLRLYERENLLRPSRSLGNTRLYTDADLERLEIVLTLTREMGVNLAGIEVVLNMREKMIEMEHQMEDFIRYVQENLLRGLGSLQQATKKDALARVAKPNVIRINK